MQPMNRRTLTLALTLFLSGCPGSGDDSSSGSSTSVEHCSAGYGDDPGVDPNFPACGCGDVRCEAGSACRADGPTPAFTSSVCVAGCTQDDDCPSLAQQKTTCDAGWCVLPCGASAPCPTEYTCSEAGICQVALLE